MAEKDEKWPENVSGKFYVDEQCIDCDLCRETAPNFFTRNEDGGYSFVHKQPESAEDVELCMEALEGCPVEAIGEDGDEQLEYAGEFSELGILLPDTWVKEHKHCVEFQSAENHQHRQVNLGKTMQKPKVLRGTE